MHLYSLLIWCWDSNPEPRRAFYQLNCISRHHEVFQESLIYAKFFLLWLYMFVLSSATIYIIWILKLLLYLLLSLAFAQSSTFRSPIAKWMLCCCFLRINIIPCFIIRWISVECLLILKIMTSGRFRNCGKLHNLQRAPYFKGKSKGNRGGRRGVVARELRECLWNPGLGYLSCQTT